MKAFKTCAKCGNNGRLSNERHKSDFHKNNSSNDGFKSICKSCANAVANKGYEYKLRPHATQVQIDEIEDKVCSELKLDREKMFWTKTREREITEGKHLIWTIIKDKYGVMIEDIKREYSVDHTSVLYGIRKVRGLMDVYPEFKALYKKIMNMTSNKYVLAYD